MEQTGGVFAEQVIRPTGLIDPPVEIKPVEEQVQDLIQECKATTALGYRTLVTTLTKRMAEDLTEYMHEAGIKVRYMHSDVETLERIELIRDLRLGVYDVLIGINLLREGLDIPECGLVAILDADKEGFLRSETSLIQTIGRAARNVDGRVILYADRITGSMERAMNETRRRREKQEEYNREHGITPTTIRRNIGDIIAHVASKDQVTVEIDDERPHMVGHNLRAYIEDLGKADAQGRVRPRVRGGGSACATRSASSRTRSSACRSNSTRRRSWAAPTRASPAPARRGTASSRSCGWAAGARGSADGSRAGRPMITQMICLIASPASPERLISCVQAGKRRARGDGDEADAIGRGGTCAGGSGLRR